jgi:hypothetical protein
MALERDEFEAWMGLLRGDIKGVHERLDGLNGRTRTVESKVAVLESQVDLASQTGSDRTARMTGLGGVLASAGALIWQWWTK